MDSTVALGGLIAFVVFLVLALKNRAATGQPGTGTPDSPQDSSKGVGP